MYWCAPWLKWLLLAAGGVGGYMATRKRKTGIKVGVSAGGAGLGYLIGYLLQKRCVGVNGEVLPEGQEPEYAPLGPAVYTPESAVYPYATGVREPADAPPRIPGVSKTGTGMDSVLEVLSPPSARVRYRGDRQQPNGTRDTGIQEEPVSAKLADNLARSPWGPIEGFGANRAPQARTRTSGMFSGAYGS
jgi:hypothetical protein